MHFCRQKLLYTFTRKDETCSLPSHFLPINTESGNSFVYHLVCRRIVISYQPKINSTFQTVLSASLNHIHHVRLTNNDVHYTFFYLLYIFLTHHVTYKMVILAISLKTLYGSLWMLGFLRQLEYDFTITLQTSSQLSQGFIKSIVKILANIGVISFLKLTEIKQQKTGRRNLVKQRRKLLIVKVHHHIIIIPSYGFA